MKKKLCRRLCGAVCLLCTVILIASAVLRGLSKPVIGGADWPTVLFTFREIFSEPAGLLLLCAGTLALAAWLLCTIKS